MLQQLALGDGIPTFLQPIVGPSSWRCRARRLRSEFPLAFGRATMSEREAAPGEGVTLLPVSAVGGLRAFATATATALELSATAIATARVTVCYLHAQTAVAVAGEEAGASYNPACAGTGPVDSDLALHVSGTSQSPLPAPPSQAAPAEQSGRTACSDDGLSGDHSGAPGSCASPSDNVREAASPRLAIYNTTVDDEDVDVASHPVALTSPTATPIPVPAAVAPPPFATVGDGEGSCSPGDGDATSANSNHGDHSDHGGGVSGEEDGLHGTRHLLADAGVDCQTYSPTAAGANSTPSPGARQVPQQPDSNSATPQPCAVSADLPARQQGVTDSGGVSDEAGAGLHSETAAVEAAASVVPNDVAGSNHTVDMDGTGAHVVAPAQSQQAVDEAAEGTHVTRSGGATTGMAAAPACQGPAPRRLDLGRRHRGSSDEAAVLPELAIDTSFGVDDREAAGDGEPSHFASDDENGAGCLGPSAAQLMAAAGTTDIWRVRAPLLCWHVAVVSRATHYSPRHRG